MTSTISKFISFLPSQIGSTSQTPLQYTSDPTKLFWADACLFVGHYNYVLGILRPLNFGKNADKYDELYLNANNIKSIILHAILVILQLAFLCSLPFFVLLPVFWLAIYSIGVYFINHSISFLLNGSNIMLVASESCKPEKDHESEYWIYMNGVSVGRDWLQSNIDRLSLTFGRRVNGVLNPTSGIVFDLIQCLIQRNLQYATDDVRAAYVNIKKAMFDEKIKKVVLILHSQGGLEGSIIIDWLLSEVPQDNLKRLEVYTFGNAANHFNNPSRETTNIAHPLEGPRLPKKEAGTNVIGHIEHYANIGDFVAQIGVLHYSQQKNRFMGRIFVSPNSGHLLNQHYLRQMFALDKNGRCMDTNEFMELPVEKNASNDAPAEEPDEREDLSESMIVGGGEVTFIGDIDSPIAPVSLSRASISLAAVEGSDLSEIPGTMKVKNLSRLWLYRNGGTPPDEIVRRSATA